MATYAERIRYWCDQEAVACDKSLSDVLDMIPSKGALSWIVYNADAWLIGDPPSQATLDALDGPTVDAWIVDQQKDEDADVVNWAAKDKALALAFKDLINETRAGVTDQISNADLKALIKSKL